MKPGAVCIEACTGPISSRVNGIFEPTAEVCGDLPVYKKKGSNDTWLEFSCDERKWYVRPSRDRNSRAGWAHCSVDVICLPQDCPAGKWKVGTGGKGFEEQSGVAISKSIILELLNITTKILFCF